MLAVDRMLLNVPQTSRFRYHDWLADSRGLAFFTDGSFRRTGTTAAQLIGTSCPHSHAAMSTLTWRSPNDNI